MDNRKGKVAVDEDSFIAKLQYYGSEMNSIAQTARDLRLGKTARTKLFVGTAHQVFDGSSLSQGSIYVGPMSVVLKNNENRESIKTHNIKAIVNCTPDVPCEFSSNLDYCVVPVDDVMGSDILSYLEGAAAFIHAHVSTCDGEKYHNVLVHCHMGVSRSVTVAMAYLIKYQGLTREEALVVVKSCRPQAKPNVGFWSQLKQFERRVQNKDEDSESNTTEVFNFLNWAKQSCITYCTLGTKLQLKQSKEFITSLLFGALKEKLIDNPSETMKKALHAAMTYVWSRGLHEFDLKWLQTLLAFLNNTNEGSDQEGKKVKDIIREMFLPGAEFHDLWTGEIYPHQMEKIEEVLSTLDDGNVEG